MKKQVLAILLTLTLLLSLLPMGAMAAEIETEETSQIEVSVVEEVTTEAETETEEAAPETEPEPEETEVSEEESASDVEEDALEGNYEETTQTYLSEEGTTSGACGDNLTWTLENGTLTISGTGDMYNYSTQESSSDKSPWASNSAIKEVIIESGVISIGNAAFSRCKGITSITIPNSVTTIGEYAFFGCTNLPSVTIPEGVTTIENGTFYWCDKLTSIYIPDGVTSIGFAAFCCSGLENVIIPSSVASIGYCAFYCEGPSYVANVYYCGSQADWSNIAIDESNDLSNAVFHFDCIVGMCGEHAMWALENGTLTIFGDGALKSRRRGESPWNAVRSKIQTVIIMSGITTIPTSSYLFYECRNQTSFQVDDNNPNYSSLDGVLFDKDQKTLLIMPMGKSGAYNVPDGVTAIGDKAFYCSALSSVHIPIGVTSIGELAFAYSLFLSEINIPDGVTEIGKNAFLYCAILENIIIPGSVTAINTNLFYGCMSLSSVKICNGVEKIGYYSFYRCSSLSEVYIPSSVTEIDRFAFLECQELNTIFVATKNQNYSTLDGVLYDKEQKVLWHFPAKKGGDFVIPDSVTEFGRDCIFGGCSTLTSVTIPESVTKIESDLFSDCGSLTGIYVAKGNPRYVSVDGVLFDREKKIMLKYPQAKDGDCYSVPTWVTAIGYNSKVGYWLPFQDCCKLTGVILPSSINAITNEAFVGCNNLKNVYYGASKDSWDSISIADSNIYQAKIYYNNTMGNATVTSTNAHTTGNILYWNAVPNAELYQIFRRTPGQPFEYLRCASGLGVKDETAKVGVTYIYAVRAVNGNLRSTDYSNQVTMERPSNIPANVTISKTNPHKTGNILYWNSVSGAKFYQIFRRTSGQPFEWITNTGGAAYKDETANAGTPYIYAIKAHNGSVKSAAYSNTVAMTRPRG